ncbi:hypothetical protein [Armatimonas sp.]|uniref:hypothetical protein n=1 Tax=Armatimonas sp. TaxID=1872638 RepID=UPI0037518A02
MRVLLLPTAALICCLSCGCASDTSRARESARTFLAAMNQGDVDKAQSVATLAARPNLATMLKDIKPSSTGFTLGEPLVKDDTAEVPVTLTSGDPTPTAGKVLLRREEKEWRVWALRFQAESGPELTLDFEHPERMVGEFFGAAVGELTKGLKSAEKTGRAFGEALGGFVKGFSEGVEKTAPK